MILLQLQKAWSPIRLYSHAFDKFDKFDKFTYIRIANIYANLKRLYMQIWKGLFLSNRLNIFDLCEFIWFMRIWKCPFLSHEIRIYSIRIDRINWHDSHKFAYMWISVNVDYIFAKIEWCIRFIRFMRIYIQINRINRIKQKFHLHIFDSHIFATRFDNTYKIKQQS